MSFYDDDDLNDFGVPIEPYTLKEMATMYKRSKKTWMKWVEPIQEELGEKKGWYYNTRQVEILLREFGKPPNPPTVGGKGGGIG
jgi:transposase